MHVVTEAEMPMLYFRVGNRLAHELDNLGLRVISILPSKIRGKMFFYATFVAMKEIPGSRTVMSVSFESRNH